MTLQLLIDAIDRTSVIDLSSISKRDQLNNRADSLFFTVRKVGSATFVPEVGSEVVLMIDGTRIFGGAITRVEESTEGERTLVYTVECADYSFYLNRELVTQRYRSETAEDIIEDILTTHAPTFTFANVTSPVTISSVAFNRLSVGQCIQKLADLTNHFWYVDYFKDLHFFPRNTEPAPFDLTDTSGNHLYDSLKITRDLTQIRNRVFIKGGLTEGEERTEEFTASGTEEERTIYRLAHKFASEPTVTLNGSPVTIGTEFLENDASFDAMWSFQEKYIRFTAGNIPADTDEIAVTGIPLFPIIVNVHDPVSIGEFGEFQFAREDTSIRSRDEAIDLALAELESYAEAITEGGFLTYTPGLRSGQIITVNSTIRGINEQFLIQSVKFRPEAADRGIYQVTFASLKTLGIIEVLQRILLDRKVSEGEDEAIISFLQLADAFSLTDEITDTVTTSPPYTWEDNPPTPQPNPIVWNKFTWV